MPRRRLLVPLVAAACALTACASNTAGGQSGTSPSHRYKYATVLGSGRTPAVSGPSTPQGLPTQRPPTPSIDAGSVPREATRFAWADSRDRVLPEAFTLTVVRGVTPRQALGLIAPDPVIGVHPVSTTIALVERHNKNVGPDLQGYANLVAATTRDGWTLVLEDNGFAASRLPTAAALSRHGPVAVLYRSVNMDYAYVYARGGRVVRAFDPLLGHSVSGSPLPDERQLRFSAGKRLFWTDALSFELTRRLTGFTTRPSDFDVAGYTIAAGVTI